MSKRMWAVATAAALVAGGFATAPVTAAPEVPENLNIVDPAGDGNYLNDGTGFGQGGKDNQTPADASSVGDILGVWFTTTQDTISAHIQTEAPGPATPSYVYRVYFSAADAEDCLAFQGVAPGVGNDPTAEPVGTLRSECGDLPENVAEGEFLQEEGPDETGIHTITLPRKAAPAFADNGIVVAPHAEVRHLAVAVTYPVIDNTEIGTDYQVVAGEPEPPTKKKPAAKGQKKGQNKGKKTRVRKCKAFAPGEAGAEAPTVKLTDKATEKKPVEQAVTLDGSVADIAGDPSSAYVNIQVDSKAKSAGLYALLEFPERRDYDMNLLHTDGSYAARARSFNPVLGTPGEQFSEPGHGGEGTTTSEMLVGIKTSDCGGWTLEAQNWLGEGGDFAIKLWLGKAKNAPQAPGEETP